MSTTIPPEIVKRFDSARQRGFITQLAASGKPPEVIRDWHGKYKTQREKREAARSVRAGAARKAILGK